MKIEFDEDTIRQLVRPIVSEIINGVAPAMVLGRDREQVLFNYAEAAEFLSVCERTVYLWVKEGKIESVRLGRLVRIHRDELDRVAREGVGG